MTGRYGILCLVLFLMLPGGCAKKEAEAPPATVTETAAGPIVEPPEIQKIEATPENVQKAKEHLQRIADRERRMHAALTFEDFKASVYKEPFEGGKFIVNGDTPIANEKQLREFYDKNVRPPQTVMLVLNQVSGMDDKWNTQLKSALKYCVSSTFGSRHAEVVQQMASATGEWEKVAGVDFIHDASQDVNCVPSNTAVVFDIRPVNVGEYLARAFFPNEPRAARNILIDESSLNLGPGKLQLAGILRHELGHTLGFRHEHTRPDAGACFEDADWVPLTSYDAFSVMHYPQCNGKGDWTLNLTDKDKNGVACVYGPSAGFTIDPHLISDMSKCSTGQPPSASGQPQTESFTGESVAKSAIKRYGPFAVTPGTTLEASTGGAGASGDPDLYVRFGAQPNPNAYDCRPYLDGPVETCSLTVPAAETQAFVMVRGYAEGTYDLQVIHVPQTQ